MMSKHKYIVISTGLFLSVVAGGTSHFYSILIFFRQYFGKGFLCPATKSGEVLCYSLRTIVCLSLCLSVRPSVCPSLRPSAVDHSCPLHNFDTVRDNFTQLGTNIKHDRDVQRLNSVTPFTFFAELFPFEIFSIEIVSAL